ncbi:hypothetical protein CONCODRAFT_11474 [Conidiobolus coronatus NRRL 28638]|uniref:Zn(2)-C6 fungal-type domain-containing protein n=1 Tax=Conidiobolus coronatus (strain ATCC 28846 / CBS 209.66 / NRRL 28638) TaxID=796925 RepID=A0A137NVB6_CONC2|nr:hypothetical protein CONCODRAFT_11474 [Conidiobolus coronatus NRRL 28638]|eukprot:KXN66638.1 hypothetical protein CONCODRAFT_11474 [Conidiobolus coronatus NRRL 28638]
MRNRVQLSCVECRRKKAKCNRLEPCTNCIKSSTLCLYTKTTQNTLEFSNQIEFVYRNHATSYYTYNKKRMVDFCHLDPKLNYIRSILDSGELEKAVGKKLRRNELNMIRKVNLENYGVDPKIHNLIEFLVGMSFQFCIFNPVTVQTIQKSYLTFGLNSYLINCISALMFPKYLLLRGIIKSLPLKDNIFYIKSLHLLTCSSTLKSEIALGTIYLLCFETRCGNLWGAMVHHGMAKSACLELRLHMVDADNQACLKKYQSIETCEKRNAWWCIMGVEIAMSLIYNLPITAQSNPKQCHMPHHLLNFSPGPYSVDEDIEHSFQNIYSPSIYEKLPHFNYVSIIIWLAEAAVIILGEFKGFYKSSKDIQYRAKLLSNLDEKFGIILNISKFFNLVDYEAKLKTTPLDYANTSALFIVITFNAFIMFFYEAIYHAYIDIKLFNLAEDYKLKMKDRAKSLFSFIAKTIKLRNYPDPEIDLTQYYISIQIIPDILVSLIKLFTPIRTIEDMEQVKFVFELLYEFSLYYPKSKLYYDWCAEQMKTNVRFNYTNDIITISQKGILKILEKSLNKQFFFQ